jgi:hypothetical protein
MNPLSGVLDEAWRMYKAYAKHLLAIAFVIYLVTAILVAVLALAGGYIGAIFALLLELVATYLLQAALVKAVQDVRDGRADMNISETVSAAVPYIWPVFLASLLAGIGIAIGLFLVIVPGLFLITIWAVIVPVIVIERSGALAAFGRSQQLVKGHGWHVFGTLVLTFIILIVVDLVLSAIFLALPHVLSDGLASIISGTIVSPFIALVVTLIYYRLVGSPPMSGTGATPWSATGQPPGYDPGPSPWATPPGPSSWDAPAAPPTGDAPAAPPTGQWNAPPPPPPGGNPQWNDPGAPPRGDDYG